MNSRSLEPRHSEESQVQPTSSEGEEVSKRPWVVTIVGLFAWALSVTAAADDDWFIGSTLKSGKSSTLSACLIVDEEDGHWNTWCALYHTFTAAQCIATVLCSFATLMLGISADSRRFARRMGRAMRLLLACSVFFQLAAVCLATSVYVHLRIYYYPSSDGSGFPAFLLGPTFVLAWGAILIAFVEICLLRICHPESRGNGPQQEPPFSLRHVYTRNLPKSRFWVVFGMGSLIVAFDVTTLVNCVDVTLVNYVDASALTNPGLQSIPLILCVSSVILLVWSASSKQETTPNVSILSKGVMASVVYLPARFMTGMLAWILANKEEFRDGIRDLWLWPLVLNFFYLGGLVCICVIDGLAIYKPRRGEQDLPQHHERSLQQRDGEDRFRHWRRTATPAEANTRPPTGVRTAAPRTSGEPTTIRLDVGGELMVTTGGREQFGSSIIWSAVPAAASVSVTRADVSWLPPAQ